MMILPSAALYPQSHAPERALPLMQSYDKQMGRRISSVIHGYHERKRKIATAICAYQADCNGEWRDIHFDSEEGNDASPRRV